MPLYMTVQGRSSDTTAAISQSDAFGGVESTVTYPPELDPQFIDYPFTDPTATFEEHLAVVRDVQPRLTVAPDVEKGRDPADVFEKADELARHADTVVVVPKDVHPSTVPDRFRVGIPTADFGSGAPWGAWDYRGVGAVHLLGGGPARQLTLAEHVPVASVDTATLGKTARFGVWDGRTVDAPGRWDYQKRLRVSLDNYAAKWD